MKKRVLEKLVVSILIISMLITSCGNKNTKLDDEKMTNGDGVSISVTNTPTSTPTPTPTSTPTPTPVPANYSIILQHSSIVYVGDVFGLMLIEYEEDIVSPVYEDFTSVSLDESIITVEDNYVTAVGIGTAQVEVTYKNTVNSIEITVGDKPTPTPTPTNAPTKAPRPKATPVPTKNPNPGQINVMDNGKTEDIVKGFTIDKTSLKLTKGESAKLNIKVPYVPNKKKQDTPTWSSFNNKVASVKNGTVTAVGGGKTTIFVAFENIILKCDVEVVSPVTGLKMSCESLTLAQGASKKITTTLLPLDVTEKATVSYASDNEEIATVDADGNVTGVAEGSCNITATANGITKTMPVTVCELLEVEELSFASSSVTLTERDSSTSLQYKYTGTEGVKPNFETSNEKIVSVDKNGVITPVSPGEATITMSLGDKSATCKVVIEKVYVVVIDPGHDATHTGAQSGRFREEVLNLKVAQATKKHLEAEYKNVEVKLTRNNGSCFDKDSDVCNRLRPQYAQDWNADILVGMHFNAGRGHGTMVLVSQYYNIKEESIKLAKLCLSELTSLGLADAGLLVRLSENGTKDPDGRKMDYYGFIKNGAIRSITTVLIEHAFIDSATDSKFFDTDEKLDKMGQCDTRAIAKYLNLKAK